MAEKKCKHCGKLFTPTGNSQKYCSTNCRKAAQSERDKEKRESERDVDNHWLIDKTVANICLTCTKPAKECKGTCKEAHGDAKIARMEEWRRQVREYHALGMNDREISDVTHISSASILKIRKELGLAANRKAKKGVKASA